MGFEEEMIGLLASTTLYVIQHTYCPLSSYKIKMNYEKYKRN